MINEKLSSYLLNPTHSANSLPFYGVLFAIIICIIVIAPSRALIHLIVNSDTPAPVSLVIFFSITLVVVVVA